MLTRSQIRSGANQKTALTNARPIPKMGLVFDFERGLDKRLGREIITVPLGLCPFRGGFEG
jgi:hypothetical protein